MTTFYNYYFDLPGITCINCVLPVINTLNNFTEFEIEDVSEDIDEKNIVITVREYEKYTHEQISQSLYAVIDSLGIECVDRGYHKEDDEDLNFFEETANNSSKKIKIHIIKALVGSLGFVIMA